MRIALHNIHKYYRDVHANDGIHMEIAEGSVQGILGENGAGKSTLMKILAGYVRKSEGMIALEHMPVEFGGPSQATSLGIGMLYQDPRNFENLTFQGKLEKEREEASLLELGKPYLIVFLPLFLALLLAFFAQRWFVSWLGRSSKWVIFLVLGSLILFLISFLLPGIFERANRWKKTAEFRKKLEQIASLMEEGEERPFLFYPDFSGIG